MKYNLFKKLNKSVNVKILCTTLILFSLIFNCSGPSEYKLWYAPGQIQAIGNKEELWLFFEIDQMAYSPNAACDTPKSFSIGHIQDVIILTADGLKIRIRIPNANGRTIHPNISHLFYFSNDLYLFSGESMHYKDSIFRWEKDHFELLPIEESDMFISNNIAKDNRISLDELKKIIPENEAEKTFKSQMEYNHYMDNKINVPYWVHKILLDSLSIKYGWEYIYGNMFCCDEKIKWNNIEDITIQSLQNENGLKISIKSSIFNNDTSTISLNYDNGIQSLDKSDYEKILNHNRQIEQKPHKKEAHF